MSFVIHQGDALTVLRTLPEASVNCCITSPPYWGLRDYGTAKWEGGDPGCNHKRENNWPDPKNPNCKSANGHGAASQRLGADCAACGAKRIDQQLGLENSPAEYIEVMVEVLAEVRRLLRDDGTLWLNLGDSYAGSWGAQSRGNITGEGKSTLEGSSMLSARQISAAPAKNPSRNPSSFRRDRADAGGLRHKDGGLKPKDLIGIPWRVALALQADGWWLRSDIIWHKPNPMPESVTDRPTKAHEYLFLLSKSESYFYDQDAIREKAIADHPAGNKHHSAADAYAGGDEKHRTKSGLVAYATKTRTAVLVGSHGTMGHDGNGMRMPEKWNNPAGRNKRSVWTLATMPTPDAHFATFPIELPETCLRAGCVGGGCRA